MISTKKLFILFFSSFLCATTSSWCKDGLQIKGKLRILKPTTLQVNDLNGTLILSCELQPNKEFATEQKLIQPDIYTLRIGKTEEKIAPFSLAPSGRGLRPQAVGERTVRLSEIFRAMARFSPSGPAGPPPSQREASSDY